MGRAVVWGVDERVARKQNTGSEGPRAGAVFHHLEFTEMAAEAQVGSSLA